MRHLGWIVLVLLLVGCETEADRRAQEEWRRQVAEQQARLDADIKARKAEVAEAQRKAAGKDPQLAAEEAATARRAQEAESNGHKEARIKSAQEDEDLRQGAKETVQEVRGESSER